MRIVFVTLMLFLGATGTAFGEANVAKDVQMSEVCRDCHSSDGFDLSGAGADQLAAKIKLIAKGEIDHPGDLSELSDADITELAKILDRFE
jgi:cytochrome c553